VSNALVTTRKILKEVNQLVAHHFGATLLARAYNSIKGFVSYEKLSIFQPCSLSGMHACAVEKNCIHAGFTRRRFEQDDDVSESLARAPHQLLWPDHSMGDFRKKTHDKV
jgi:hypothetical protein